jgi:alpha-tubulin suppressor-like RCC1 family protein
MNKNRAGNFILTASATSGATANGIDTNSVTITLTDLNGYYQPDESIDVSVISGTAIFPDSQLNHITVTTGLLGQVVTTLTDTISETVTIKLVLLSDTSVTAQTTCTFGGVTETLPAPTIDNVQSSIIDPEAYPDGVDVRVPSSASLAVGDVVTVYWIGQAGEGTVSIEETIDESSENQSLIVKIESSVLVSNSGFTIQIYYSVLRAINENLQESARSEYEILEENGSSTLIVMGARSQRSLWLNEIRTITSLDSVTREPIESHWWYEEQENLKTYSSRFVDVNPEKLLHVENGTEHFIINRLNFDGNEYSSVARMNNNNLVAWGDPHNGGLIPESVLELPNISSTCAANDNFVVTYGEGSVEAWGNVEEGFIPSEIASLSDIKHVIANQNSYLALRTNNRVVAWGNATSGGQVPSFVASLSDIKSISCTVASFCVLRTNGSVMAWGNENNGGVVPEAISNLTNINSVTGNHYGYACILDDKSVVAWTHSNYNECGGNPPELHDIVQLCSSEGAFAALDNSGSVHAWGDPNFGGSLPDEIKELDNIVGITGGADAFAVTTEDGHVYAWGNQDNGGKIPPEISKMTNVVQVTSSSSKEWKGNTFCALLSNGSIVVWGGSEELCIIDNETLSRLVEVRAVYNTVMSFAAITDDSTVITWGYDDVGGDSSEVESQLNNNISYSVSL